MATSTHPALDPERVERLLKAAKNEPVPFAFARDPKSETGILAADKTRTGKALLELCRKETGAKKGAYGTVSVEGVNATFLCERNELTQLSKALLGWFKAQKLSLKVTVTEEEDAASEDEGEEKAGEAQEKTQETGKDRRPQARAPEATEQDTEQEDDGEEEDPEEDIPEGKMFDPAVIVPLIRRAKKRPRPFAFGIGPDIDLLAAHPKADPMRLARKVREEGAKKGIWGMVQMDGAVALFTCEKEPFSGARKGLKRWIKQQGLTLKFRLNGPDGEFIDPEDDEAEEDGTSAAIGTNNPAGTPANADLAALASRLAALLPALKERAGDPGQRDIIRQSYAACDAAIKAGNAEEAEAGLRQLAQLASTPAPAAGSVPVAELAVRWEEASTDALGQLATLRRELLKFDDEDLERIARGGLAEVQKLLEQHLAPISRLLAAANQDGATLPADTAGALSRNIGALRKELASDDRIRACDNNPFGVRVAIQNRLDEALDTLETACAAAA
jgi:hypothetical protein